MNHAAKVPGHPNLRRLQGLCVSTAWIAIASEVTLQLILQFKWGDLQKLRI